MSIFDSISNFFLPSALTQVNGNFDTTEAELAARLKKDGSVPMSGNLDMNSNRLLNLADGTSNTDAATVAQVKTIPKGDTGDRGPQGYTVTNLAGLKAAEVTDTALMYDGAIFTWETTNAPYTADEINIVASDNVDVSVGAWVRQKAQNLLADDGTTVQANLDQRIPYQIGKFSDADGASLPNASLLQTAGHSENGTGQARYVLDAAVDATYVAANPRTSFLSAGGNGYRLAEQRPNAAMFGALPDDGTATPPDATEAVQALFNHLGQGITSASKLGGGEALFPFGQTYLLKNTVYIPHNVAASLNFCTFKPHPDAVLADFDQNALFVINADSGGDQVVAFGGLLRPPLRDFYLLNDKSDLDTPSGDQVIPGLTAIWAKGRINIDNFLIKGFDQAIVKAGSSGNEYVDQVTITGGQILNAYGTDYQIDIIALGDNLLIDNVAFQLDPPNRLGISIRETRGGRISRIENGTHLLDRCDSITLSNLHMERGWIESKSSGFTLEDSFFIHHESSQTIGAPIVLSIYDSNRRALPVSLRNISFLYQSQNFSTQGYATPIVDIIRDKRVPVTVVNCYRRANAGMTDLALLEISAAQIGAGTSTSNAIWAPWSKIAPLAARGAVIRGDAVDPIIKTVAVPAAATTMSVTTPSANTGWLEADGAYYYKAAYLYGPTDRLIGVYSAESNVAITAPTPPVIQPSLAIVSYDAMTLRLFRGTATGSYDKVVDKPAMGDAVAIDLGYWLSSGERWQDQSAGAAPSINTNISQVRIIGDNVECVGSAAPSYGTWKVNDRVINSAPAETGTAGSKYVVTGWRCVTAGTPGTWVEEHALTGN